MAPGLNDDLTRAVAEGAAGGALRVTDITGIGQKTANNLRAAGYRSVQDIKNATPDELASVPGIGKSTAQQAIREAGGDPRENARRSGGSGSVSAAGIRVPAGEFKVGIGDKDNADARFSSSLNRGVGRSQEAAAADKGKRAPVTTDFELWKENKGRLDFPGVDTPTEDPQVQRQDREYVDAEDTTLEQETGSLFVRENNSTGGFTNSVEGLFAGSRSPGPGLREAAGEVAAEDAGADLERDSGGSAVADVNFLRREGDTTFDDEFIPFGAEDSDRNSFEF